jgi:hypothetical protein
MPARSPRTGNTRGDPRKGIVLLSVLILLFFFTALGAALMALVFSRLNAVILDTDRLKAEYLAEAGMAKALYERTMGMDIDGNDIGNIGITYFGEGLFKVDHDPKGHSLVSTGMVHDVRRTSFIKYATQ